MPSRKEVLKTLAAMPLGIVAGGSMLRASEARAPASTAGNQQPAMASDGQIFRSIGVEPVINCRGTFTIIGGSLERPQVRKAMDDASHSFIQFDELADGIGPRLAELTGAEWGMVSAGCAAAIKHATVACVAGGNPEKLIRIPYLNEFKSGFEKTEVVIPDHSRNAYDHAIRNIGVDVITIGNPEELKNALSSRTAMIYMLAGRTGPLGLKAVSGIARNYDVPVLVDAAAEDLTVPNVHLEGGATMVSYSGGKALRGPQCAGLLLGRKDLLQSAWQAAEPHHGPGRDNKVGREEMMGMLAAVEAWFQVDHRAEWKQWLSWLDHIAERVSKVNGVNTTIEEPTIPGMEHPGDPAPISNHSPRLEIYWDPDKLHLSGEELAETMGRTTPRIVVGSGAGPKRGTTSINITAWMMQPGNAEVVADQIYRLLSKKRSPKATRMAAPAGTLTGRWKVNMEYYSSQSEHAFYIELQDDNWIEGAHKGDFTVGNLAGTIEGNTVKLLSTFRRPGDHVTNIFTGTLSGDGDTISGGVFLGEYRRAKFTATRQAYSQDREPINVPEGPPLAT